MFKQARWGDENPTCPRCGHDEHSFISTRKQFRCKGCKHTYTVTSGTIFASHKLPLRTYLAAIALYTNAAKGMSALQMSRDLDCQYKSAWVLVHKIRESLMDSDIEDLDGEVEVDAAYVNGHVRPSNRIENHVDRRRKENQDPEKRAILVARERCESGNGASRTITGVAMSENEATILSFVKKNVEPGSTISADEHHAYDALHGHYKTERVNHSKMYVGPLGENTNQAESFFSRFRRMQLGQTHKFGNLYLDRYANEAAYREDTRRRPNGDIFQDIMFRCANTKESREFRGYWQNNKRHTENLITG